MARPISKIAPGWWDYTTLPKDLLDEVSRLSIADIENLTWKPRIVNVKPSRIGGLEDLFAAYAYCEREGIGAYGGGQTELSVGRDQIQYLAAMMHPDTPNDVAPSGYNETNVPAGLPTSPLELLPRSSGFGLQD